MASVRVLFVISTALRRGAELQATLVAESLAELGAITKVVALESGAESGPHLEAELLGRRSLGLSTLLKLRRTASDFDVVVAFGSRSLPACAVALSFGGTKWVYRNIGDPLAWQRGWLHRQRTGALMRRAFGIVALWPGSAEAITRSYRVRPERIAVIPNNRSCLHFTPPTAAQRDAARALLGVPSSLPIAAFIGSLSSEKNPELAIDAMAKLPEAHLLVAGDGPLRAACEELGRASAPGRVHLLGAVADVRSVYHAADVVLLTSRTEGMPGVLIEAGMSGLPVVSTDVGAVLSIVVDGETGFVVEPSVDAVVAGITAALALPAEKRELARAVCIERFDRDSVADRWLRHLEAVCDAITH